MKGRSSTILVLIALGMLALIVAQLVWWLIFFQRNENESARLRSELDAARLALANAGIEGDRSGLRYDAGTQRWLPDPEVQARRAAESRRRFIMLLSETIFVILVIGYGHVRVIRAVQRERKLNHERHVFIDSVTHELKTPLTSILLNLQTVLKRDPPPEQRRELIEAGIADTRRLEEQLNNILHSGRLARRGSTPGAQTAPGLSLRRCLEQYFAENKARLEGLGLLPENLSIAVPSELCIAMHADDFRRVVDNLVQNAVTYTGERPPVLKIEASSDRGRRLIILRFADQGAGIPPAELDNVFHAFYRLTGEGRRPVRGSGIGLYIVKEIVEGSGGRVRAFSEGTGRGACFELRIPGSIARLTSNNTRSEAVPGR